MAETTRDGAGDGEHPRAQRADPGGGRSAGLEFLDAHERTLQTFVRLPGQLADASQSDRLTQMMEAQANFTRDVVSAVGEVSRGTLRK